MIVSICGPVEPNTLKVGTGPVNVGIVTLLAPGASAAGCDHAPAQIVTAVNPAATAVRVFFMSFSVRDAICS
jgi:hypothetical protein